jgi:hypothetical protein
MYHNLTINSEQESFAQVRLHLTHLGFLQVVFVVRRRSGEEACAGVH